MPSNRHIDKNGYLLVKGCPISSYGIFDYSAGQLGLEGDPNRIVKVFRPESAISSKEAIESFKNVPLINDHEMLSGSGLSEDGEEMTTPEEYGIDGVLTSNVYYDSPWLRGDLKIFSREMQEAIESGKKDLSLGYSCDFVVQPGVYNGQSYEVVQDNMRGNHIALVDVGRVPGAKVLDGLIFDHLSFDVRPSKKGSDMKRKSVSKKAMDNAVEQLKALLPALQEFLNEEATEPAHQEGAEEELESEELGGEMGNETGEEEDARDEEGGAELASIVGEVEALLSKLKAAMGGHREEEGVHDEDERHEGEDGDIESQIRNDGESSVHMDESEHHGEDEHHEGEDEDEDERRKAEGRDSEEPVGENGGRASKGPSAGKHSQAGDAAIRAVYADIAAKTRLYNRLSNVVGAFDHAAMDAAGVARYGVKKLGLKVNKGSEFAALDAYLLGVERAKRDSKARVRSARTGDSATPSTEALDNYLSGK
jgi:hypothetical protein